MVSVVVVVALVLINSDVVTEAQCQLSCSESCKLSPEKCQFVACSTDAFVVAWSPVVSPSSGRFSFIFE